MTDFFKIARVAATLPGDAAPQKWRDKYPGIVRLRYYKNDETGEKRITVEREPDRDNKKS